ncbi:hypothetical protein GW891_02995 [bacterium]|nr:hypothetical protein [bacterium]
MAYLVIGKLTSFISAHNSCNFIIASSILFLTHSSKPSSKYSFGTQILYHFKSFLFHISGFIKSFHDIDVFSLGSNPFITSYNNAESFTVFVNVHGQSKLDAIAITQNLLFLQ